MDCATNRYDLHLPHIDQVMLGELDLWPWHVVSPMRGLIERQLRQPGKRLRPRLAMAVADLFGGPARAAYPGAASIEFYHVASLILDDIQDASALRHGTQALHTIVGTGTAINVAATIRSLSYHTVHHSALLRPDQKLELHRRLDTAATYLLLGQSIDVGWQSGWFAEAGEFPYEQMAAWKTGSLFACAAATAAVACDVPMRLVDEAEQLGSDFGMLYQLIDDYCDAFDSSGDSALPGDIAEGRPGYPEIVLRRLESSSGAGCGRAGALLLSQCADSLAGSKRQQQVLDRMADLDVQRIVRRHIQDRARQLISAAKGLGTATDGIADLVACVLSLAGMKLAVDDADDETEEDA